MVLLTYYSSYLFLLPVMFYFLTNNNVQAFIPIILFINFILSVLFWSNPIKKSWIHRIDSVFAKISITINILYIYLHLSNPQKYLFVYTVTNMFYLFYLSNKYSMVEWLSKLHILSHCYAHIMAVISLFFMFIN